MKRRIFSFLVPRRMIRGSCLVLGLLAVSVLLTEASLAERDWYLFFGERIGSVGSIVGATAACAGMALLLLYLYVLLRRHPD